MQQRVARHGVRVAHAAVVHGRVEHVGDVGGGARLDRRQQQRQLREEVGFRLHERRREEQALVRVVARHDAQRRVELALQQQLPREGGHEVAVDNLAVRR